MDPEPPEKVTTEVRWTEEKCRFVQDRYFPQNLPYFTENLDKNKFPNCKLKRFERKVKNNEKSALADILLSLRLTFTSKSNWILIWGPSLTLGVPKSDLLTFVNADFRVKLVEEVRIYPDKPWAFVKIKAEVAATEINPLISSGRVYEPHGSLSICFSSKEPPEEDLSVLEPFKSPKPQGIRLLESAIDQNEEKTIISSLDFDKEEVPLKNRAVLHYGYEFKYGSNDVDLNQKLNRPIPAVLEPIIQRWIDQGLFQRVPDQLTVNKYSPGHGIPPHVDTHSPFEEPIVSLSLGSPTIMDFKRGIEHSSVILQPRSLLLLFGEARYDWTHGIKGRTCDVLEDQELGGLTLQRRGMRISLTFRWLNASRVCNCQFPTFCDTRNQKKDKDKD